MSGPAGPGEVLELIRRGHALTRAQLMQATGLSRSTLAKRIDALIAHGYIEAFEVADSSGGRPPATFTVNRETGVLLLTMIDADGAQLALCDLTGTVLARQNVALASAPGTAHEAQDDGRYAALEHGFDALLRLSRRSRDEVKGIGIGLGIAAPIDLAVGRHVEPVRIADERAIEKDTLGGHFASAFHCPVHVDHQINLSAIAEHRLAWPEVTHLLCIDVGETVEAALIIDGVLQRGAQGAACDFAHLPVAGLAPADGAPCHCGRSGCLEAHASAPAILRDLAAQGHPVRDVADVAELARRGVRDAIVALHHAGVLLGEAVALAVNLINPSLVVLRGDLAQSQGHLLAALRETVYRRSTARATRHLQIVAGALGDDAALAGTALLVSDAAHAPHAVDAYIDRFG